MALLFASVIFFVYLCDRKISLAAYNLRIRLKASVHTSVCTVFALLFQGYARRPA